MAKFADQLPQLGDRLFLSDGGIETTLLFHEGFELRDFAAFDLLKAPAGRDALRRYFRSYVDVAARFGLGLILESATWRASSDWGIKLGYTRDALAEVNRAAIHLLEEIRDEAHAGVPDMVISGCVGPRADGYMPQDMMTVEDAAEYHRAQVDVFTTTAADMVCAITMNYLEEAAGIARAAEQAGMPVAISFTVETDGRLPTGETLQSAIERTDEATSFYPLYYMINCAHPTHFQPALAGGAAWVERIRGLRANASHKSHAELNESAELDIGDPVELARQYAELRQSLPNLNVMGGCCGTDHRHVEAIAAACAPLFPERALSAPATA
jgi:S-methylmethionine-dependent homocysteine/selenocysteine methylase